ncbi:MAG: MFS transporter [Hyphomonadaceae bacterium]
MAAQIAGDAAADASGRAEGMWSVGGLSPAWRSVFVSALMLALGASVVLVLSFGPFAQAIGRDNHWAPPQVSLGATIIALMLIPLSPLQGALVDRFGARLLALISLPIFGLSLAGMYWLPARLEAFYAACVWLPIAGLGLWPLTFATVATSWFTRRLGLALGVVMTGIGVGGILIPAALGFVLPTYGWRMAYLLIGLLVLFVVFPVAVWGLREGERARSTGVGADAPPLEGYSLGEGLASRSFLIIAGAFAVLGIFSSSLIVHQVGILTSAGMSVGAAISLQALVGAATIVGRLGSGWLLDKVPAAALATVLFLCGAGVCAIYASPFAMTYAAVAAIGVGLVIGGEFDLLAFVIRRYLGQRAFGKLYGFLFSVFQLGAAAGTYALALAPQQFGSYRPGLIVLGGLCLLGATLFLAIGPYRFAASK